MARLAQEGHQPFAAVEHVVASVVELHAVVEADVQPGRVAIVASELGQSALQRRPQTGQVIGLGDDLADLRVHRGGLVELQAIARVGAGVGDPATVIGADADVRQGLGQRFDKGFVVLKQDLVEHVQPFGIVPTEVLLAKRGETAPAIDDHPGLQP